MKIKTGNLQVFYAVPANYYTDFERELERVLCKYSADYHYVADNRCQLSVDSALVAGIEDRLSKEKDKKE